MTSRERTNFFRGRRDIQFGRRRAVFRGTRRRAEQGNQTINILPNINENKRRDEDANNRRKSPMTYPSWGGPMSSFYEGEIVVAYKNNDELAPFGGIDAKRIEGFTSFNGIYFGGVSSPEELEEKMYFVGVMKADYIVDPNVPGTDVGQKEGMAVYVGGTLTVYNIGMEEFYPGDAVVWNAPAFHNEIGERTRKTKRRGKDRIPNIAINGETTNKLTAILSRYDTARKNGMVHEIYRAMTRKGDKGIERVDIDSILKGQRHSGTAIQEAAALFKRVDIHSVIEGVRALQAMGLVMITPPDLRIAIERAISAGGISAEERVNAMKLVTSTVSGAVGRATFLGTALSHYQTRSFEDLNKKTYEADVATRQRLLARDNDATMWLTAVLGTGKSASIKKNPRWTSGLIDALYSGCIADSTKLEATLPQLGGVANLGWRKGMDSLLRQHLMLCRNGIGMRGAAFYRAVQSLNSRVIGKALNNSAPGEQLDLVVGYNPAAAT